MSKKIWFTFATLIILFLSSLTPFVQSTGTHQTRVWIAKLEITNIKLNNSTFEPTHYNEYRNQPHEILVTIQNTGTVAFSNLRLGYKMKRGSITDLEGVDKSKKRLKISEEYTYSIPWTPIAGGGTQYTLYVELTADSFGETLIEKISRQKIFVIRDVKFDIGPVNFEFQSVPAFSGYDYANRSQIVNINVKNFGNFDLSTQFKVSAAIYSSIDWHEVWSDTKTVSKAIAADKVKTISFDNPWHPPHQGLFLINLSTELNNDDKSYNNNMTLQVGIIDIIDAGISSFTNLDFGKIYPVIPYSVKARISNFGNLNITTDFLADLKISSYPSGKLRFRPLPMQVSSTGPGNISKPGSSTVISFPTWTYATGLKPGKFWVNLSINPTETNGSVSNNEFSIVIEMLNYTDIHVECLKPNIGLQHPEDINKVVAKVSNLGTVDLEPFLLNLTILNLDRPGEVWQDVIKTPVQPRLPWKCVTIIEMLDDWKFSFNSKFRLNISLALSSEPGTPIVWCTCDLEIIGGEVNGTLIGCIYGKNEEKWLEGIKVNVTSKDYSCKYTNTTTTDANGYFSIIAPGRPAGFEYSVVISEKDNYWWFEKSVTSEIFSGRTTELNLTLIRRPVGKIKGTVNLLAPEGAPVVKKDWSGVTISVEDTPIKIAPDSKGNFQATVVAGVMNINATKSNFKTAWLKYITVLPNTTEELELNLIESWSVSLSPQNKAIDVNPSSTIIAKYDQPLATASIKPSTFELLDSDGFRIQDLAKDNYLFKKSNMTCWLQPTQKLEYNSTYKLKLTTGILTVKGTPALHRLWESTFTTAEGLGSVGGFCKFYWSQMPISGALVKIKGLPEINVLTDDDGSFIIDNIPKGDYIINVANKDYPGQSLHITIHPDTMTWANFSFDEGVPVPLVWGLNEIGNVIKIGENMSYRIKVDSKFNLTSEIPLHPDTVTSENIKIIERSTSKQVEFKNITSYNNNLKFTLEPEFSLKYDTIYQIYFGRSLRTLDRRELFWKDYLYGEFQTQARHSLGTPSFFPPDKAVNIPLDTRIFIDFPISMNRSSVENSINTTFNVIGFIWSDYNMTLEIEHGEFEYFTTYKLSLVPGMVSESGRYILVNYINISFTTISGFIQYVLGPVVDTSGKPVVGASVVIFDSQGERISSSLTNETGYASFYFDEPLPPGNYTVKILKKGWKTIEWEILIDQTGELVSGTEPPPIPRTEKADETKNGFWYIPIIILIIIMLILLFLIFFKIKPLMKQKSDSETLEQDKPKPTPKPEPESIASGDTIEKGAASDKPVGPKVAYKQETKKSTGLTPAKKRKETGIFGENKETGNEITSTENLIDKIKTERK